MDRRNSLKLLTAALAAGPVFAGEEERLPAIPLRPIPSSGEKIPVLGLCSASNSQLRPKQEVSSQLQAWYAAGMRMLLVSPRHPESAETFGNITAELGIREKLFLTSLVLHHGKEPGIAAMKATMKSLGVEQMDLFLVSDLADAKVQLDTLRGWKKDGIVRYIGIEHILPGPKVIEEMCTLAQDEVIDFIHVHYSVSRRESENRLLGIAADKGIAVLAKFPIGGGSEILKQEARPVPAWAGELGCKSWRQLNLKFALTHPAITSAVIHMIQPSLMIELIQATNGPMPDEKMRARILSELRA